MRLDTSFLAWGTWSFTRELIRGLFHFAVGFVGWLLVHPVHLPSVAVSVALVAVGLGFLGFDLLRLAVAKSKEGGSLIRSLQRVNLQVVRQYLVRDAEDRRLTTTILSLAGLFTAWVIAPRWIGALVALLFGAVDPCAELGKKFPVRRFANGKSLGGMLFGLSAGALMAAFVAFVNLYYPIFPAISAWHIAAVFAVGVASAPVFGFFGGRWDNFWVPAGAALLMSVADIALPP